MLGPGRALALRTAGDVWVRTLSFAMLFGVFAAANTIGYRKSYPTLADRLQFADGFGANKAARLFYGTPLNLETVGGYASWRVGGLLALAAAFFGLWAAVSVLRSEEESGRAEIVAAGAITRRTAFAVRLLSVGAVLTVPWLATMVGLVAGGLPVAGSAYLALAVVAPAAVYCGVGSLASQLSPTGRGAMGIAGAVLGFDFAVRVLSDTADLQWLHWALPLGWTEELRPFADPRPAILFLPLAAMAGLIALALALNGRRDIGAALLAADDIRERPDRRLLASPTLLALRSTQISLAVWAAGVGAFAILVGGISKSVASGISSDLGEQMRKIGGVDLTKPAGYIGLTFLFFVLAVAMFCCSQLAAIREEEAEGRLETLFALPESRTGWLAGRLALAIGGATMLALAAGFGAAVGAVGIGADVSVPRLIEAGLNCLPASLLFLGIGALLVTIAPRVGVGMSYAVVGVAFVWELVGALLGVPGWMLGISPFHQVGLVPAASFRAAPAAVMLGLAAAALAAAVALFRHRDLVGA